MPRQSESADGVRVVQGKAGWDEQRRRQAAVDLHRRKMGDWCPGVDGRPAHDVLAPNTLTTAHDAVVTEDPRSILVLCRACSRRVSAS